jgi:hypothetical protein
MNIDFSKLVPDKVAVVLAAVSCLGGWGIHALSVFNLDQQKLDEHTAQIQHLQTGQRETHDKLNDIGITILKVDGKLDVLNQKIDDDRANAKTARQR